MLLVAHAEALLLVDDEKAEIFKLDILLQQPVCADNEVALAGFEIVKSFIDLRRRSESAQYLDRHREAEKTLHGGLIMLLGKHRRWHQNCRLPVIKNALHDSAQCDLGLAVADIAAQKPIHRHARLHVGLDLAYAAELIVRFRVAEVILKFALPRRILGKCMTRDAGTLGIQGYKLLG